jgi:excinuclease ABC subunit A
VRYQGLSVSEVLALTFNEARAVFANHRKIHQLLHFACELGLGYLSLGQPSSTLSGGESQRIKLVSELASRRSNDTLYILDEPTTGLHRADVTRLLIALRNLVSRGNSVIIIEHDHDVIAGSDHVIELGPGPADKGGDIIFEGPPGQLLKAKTPWGEILRRGTTYTSKKSQLKAAG